MPKVPNTFTLTSLCFQSGNVLAKKMTANTFVMVFWREICLVPQVIFSICQCVVFCLLLSISALYFIACVCSMLRHSSTVGRILSPATSFLSLQSGNDKTIWCSFWIQVQDRTILQGNWGRPEHDVPLLCPQCASFGGCHDDCCGQGNFSSSPEIIGWRRGDDLGNTRKNAYFSQNIFPLRLAHKICSGDHCQLLLLHLLERALWSLRDPQHLHCKTLLCSYVGTKWPCILLMCDADDVKALLKQGFGWDPLGDTTSSALWVGQWLRLHRWSLYLELYRLISTQMKYVPGTISTDFDTDASMNYVPGTISTYFDTSLPQMVYVAVAMLVTNTIASLSVIIVRYEESLCPSAATAW